MSIASVTRHSLTLEFPDYLSTDYLAIDDSSLYATQLQVKCPTLQIVPPGFTTSVDFVVVPGFRKLYTACDLTLQTSDCGNRWPLPDGVYTVKYSVAPNDKVWVEYAIMRVSTLLGKYNQALADLDLRGCEPTPEVKERLKDLRLIKSFIDASRAMVEYRDMPQYGIELYMYAQKKLEKLCTARQF